MNALANVLRLLTHTSKPCLLAAALITSATSLHAEPHYHHDIALPDMGESSATIFGQRDERRLGAYTVRRLREANYILDDLELTRYLQGLIDKLATAGGFNNQHLTIFLIRDSSINAFALPGGYMGVNTGLLMASQTESELAAVLAHEITHIMQRHIARSIEANQGVDLLATAAIIAAIIVSGSDPDVTQAAVGGGLAAVQQRKINHTRSHEYEADRIGIALLHKAGFDPAGMAAFFGRLEDKSRYYSNVPEILRTHPISSNRISEAKARAAKWAYTPKPDSLSYYLMKERARVASITDIAALTQYYQLNKPKNTQEKTALDYGKALTLSRAGRHPQAQATLKPLLASAELEPVYYLAAANNAAAAGLLSESERQYDALKALYPNDALFAFQYAEALLKAGESGKAFSLLLKHRPSRFTRHRYYLLLSRAASEQKLHGQANLYLAEHHLVNGRKIEAIKQLRRAKSRTDLSQYARTRIEARMNEINPKP